MDKFVVSRLIYSYVIIEAEDDNDAIQVARELDFSEWIMDTGDSAGDYSVEEWDGNPISTIDTI